MSKRARDPSGNPAPGGAEQASVIVSIDDACVDKPAVLDRVLSDCVVAGFQLSQNLSNIGILAGRVAREKIADLRRISHVRSVDLDEQRRAL